MKDELIRKTAAGFMLFTASLTTTAYNAAWGQDAIPPTQVTVPAATAGAPQTLMPVPAQAAAAPLAPTQQENVPGSRLYKHLPADALLHRRVTMKLDDANLDAVVVALQKAGLPVRLDEGIKPDRKFTLLANNIPVGKVIEAVALQANLVICPQGEGARLERCPEMSVNGKMSFYQPSNMPWSDEWDTPKNFTGVGRTQALQSEVTETLTPALPEGTEPPVPVGTQAPVQGFQYVPANPTLPSGPNTLQYIPNDLPVAPPATSVHQVSLMVTALSEHSFVVSEAGTGPHNEAGYFLTVYHLTGIGTKAGEKLVAGPRVFHKSPPLVTVMSQNQQSLPYYGYWNGQNVRVTIPAAPAAPTTTAPAVIGPLPLPAPAAPAPTIGPKKP